MTLVGPIAGWLEAGNLTMAVGRQRIICSRFEMINTNNEKRQQERRRRWGTDHISSLRPTMVTSTSTSTTRMDAITLVTMMLFIFTVLFSSSCQAYILRHAVLTSDRSQRLSSLPLSDSISTLSPHSFRRRKFSLNVIMRSNDNSSSNSDSTDDDDYNNDNLIGNDKDNNSNKYDDMTNEDINDENDGNDDGLSFDMATLQSRISELSDRENKLPLVVLDAMLPRQVLSLNVQNELLIELVRDCLRREQPFVGMIGLARLSSGQTIHLSRGVEVEIVIDRDRKVSSSSSSSVSLPPISTSKGGLNVSFKAGRRFQVVDGGVQQAFVAGVGRKRWTEGLVKFLDSEEEESDEVKNGNDPSAVARAVTKAMELTSPNMRTPNNVSLVDRWIELAKANERQPRQIETLLQQLGDIPPANQPSERAFWVGALINPLPALGVALEIRPALLTAKTAEKRVEIALDGIFKSIKHMDGSQRLW